MNKKLMTVNGIGKVTAPPDQAVINFLINNFDIEYGSCIQILNQKVDEFFQSLKAIGVQEKQTKMSDFKVRENDEYSEDRRTRVFAGYDASYTFNLTVDLDHKLINRILNSVARTSGQVKINLRFTVRDEAALMDHALEMAVVDAKSKAQLLANASGVKLGKIENINYGDSEPTYRSDLMLLSTAEESTPYFSEDRDLNPEDVAAENSVRISWEIDE